MKLRKFRFLGYRNLLPCPDDVEDYDKMDSTKYYWFVNGQFTVGKTYDALHVYTYDGVCPSDSQFIDDAGLPFFQELQFFEEIFE